MSVNNAKPYQRSRQHVLNVFSNFDQHIQDAAFRVGDFLSVSDIVAFAAAFFAAKALDLALSEPFTALKGWHQTVSRPGAQA